MNNLYYLLGFVVGDGSLAKNNSISIRLSRKDIELLNCFSKIFGGTVRSTISKIKDREYKSCAYYIPPYIRDMFICYGIVCNKTHEDMSLIFELIPNEFKRDFIRGFFDADGTIYVRSKGSRYTFGIVSKKPEILLAIKSWIGNKIDEDVVVKFDITCNCFRLIKSGNVAVSKIYDTLYYKNCLSLKRKEEIFSKCKPHLFKGYCLHKSSGKYRITVKPFTGKVFKTINECKIFLEDNDERITCEVAPKKAKN